MEIRKTAEIFLPLRNHLILKGKKNNYTWHGPCFIENQTLTHNKLLQQKKPTRDPRLLTAK